MKKLLLILPLLIALVLGFQNCSQSTEIQVSQQSFAVPIANCTTTTNPQILHVVFMADNSNSTLTTDPNESVRVATVQNFLTKYGTNTAITYSYSKFEQYGYTYDGSTQSFVSNPVVAFGDASFLTDAMNLFKQTPTVGYTNYKDGFSQMTKIISEDQTISMNQKYVVIFMSDGAPGDEGSGAAQATNITADTQALINLGPAGQIVVNTIYFGPVNATAENNLQAMATAGGGQFIDTNVTQNFSIDSLINQPPLTVCN